jgi:hypothetical protein
MAVQCCVLLHAFLPMLQYNDFVSSVRVPLGLSVTLRENTNRGGRGLTITGPADIACLVNFNFNDITSSMRIGE